MSLKEYFIQQSLFKLDSYQLEAIDHLDNDNSVIVFAPTGSGKTVIAEYAVFKAIASGKQVIYTTPLKALSNQKYRDLKNFYKEDMVGLVTGDVTLNRDGSVLVMTTEILRNIMYQDKESLHNVAYIILDECHYLGDDARGTVWEEVIIHCPEHIALVALSATIANAVQLADWISLVHRSIKVVSHFERSVPLRHYILDLEKEEIVPVAKGLAKMNKDGAKKNYLENVRKREDLDIGGLVKQMSLKDFLPVIYFIFSRRGCEDALKKTLRYGYSLVSQAEKRLIRKEIQEVIDKYQPLLDSSPISRLLLKKALSEGISVHHAGLMPILRGLIENLFQQGLIKAVFATETLAAGINMPARTTVISRLSKYCDSGLRALTVGEFRQMTGRAGRRGMDTVGNCVVIPDRYTTAEDITKLIKGDVEPTNSRFSISYGMVLSLLHRFSPQEAKDLLDRSFGQYQQNQEITILSKKINVLENKLKAEAKRCRLEQENPIKLGDYEKQREQVKLEEKTLNREYQRFVSCCQGYVKSRIQKGAVVVIKAKEVIKPAVVVRVFYSNKGNLMIVVLTGEREFINLNVNLCLGITSLVTEIPDDFDKEVPFVSVGQSVSSDKEYPFLSVLDLIDKPVEEICLPLSLSKQKITLQSREEALHVKKTALEENSCSSCNWKKICGRFMKEEKKLREKIDFYQDSIDSNTDSYWHIFQKIVKVLRYFGYLEDYRTTGKGETVAYLHTENELFLGEVLFSGILDKLNAIEVAGLLSSLIYEGVRGRNSDKQQAVILPKSLLPAVRDVQRIAKKIQIQQEKEGVNLIIRLDFNFIPFVLAWGEHASWLEIAQESPLDEGDIVRNFHRLIDLLRQIQSTYPKITPELYEKIKDAIYLIDRDLVKDAKMV